MCCFWQGNPGGKTIEERRSSLDAEIDSLTSILADLECSSPYKPRPPQVRAVWECLHMASYKWSIMIWKYKLLFMPFFFFFLNLPRVSGLSCLFILYQYMFSDWSLLVLSLKCNNIIQKKKTSKKLELFLLHCPHFLTLSMWIFCTSWYSSQIEFSTTMLKWGLCLL